MPSDVTGAADRDTTPLVRLLTVLCEPTPPADLVGRTLTILCDVFDAEVACVAQMVGDRLAVTSGRGLPPDGGGDWVAGTSARRAMAGTVVTVHGGLDAADLPEPVAHRGIASAAWVPISPGTDGGTLLILLRGSDAPFTSSDVALLTAVGRRLRLADEERERGAVLEQLARYGSVPTRQLSIEQLLDEAAGALARLTGADRAWIVTMDGGVAHLRAHRGLSAESVSTWPRPADGNGPPPGPGELRVPVMHDHSVAALLYVARWPPRPFPRDTSQLMAIFANHLAAAITNADLRRAVAERTSRDSLTSLANRSTIAAYLEEVLGRAAPGNVGLLFLDLDGFQAVNDRFGHEVGDELLQQVADRLRRRVRPNDMLARFGGDEFVIVADGVRTLSDVADIGRRVAADLNTVFSVSGARIHVSAGIGGVLGVRGAATPSAMLRDADAAMHAAKAKGPGQIEVFDDDASHRTRDQLDLRTDVQNALDRRQLHLRYQPIFSLTTGRILSFESLLRWKHPMHGEIPPADFISLAEETGAIVAIGNWVLRKSCRQLAAWHRLPHWKTLSMSVNVSPAQLRQPRAAERTLSLIRHSGLEPSDIWLEVAEHSYLRHDVTEYATTLRAAGVRFALDDFGTAYSNLAYLQRLPIEILKIDQSFVSGVTGPDLDFTIVKAILGIAESLGLAAIAEGIETEKQRDLLRGMGCRLGQGYLLSPPLTPAEATHLLQTHHPLGITAGTKP